MQQITVENKRMVKQMRKDGKTYEDIGKALGGVTRQRVSQIVKDLENERLIKKAHRENPDDPRTFPKISTRLRGWLIQNDIKKMDQLDGVNLKQVADESDNFGWKTRKELGALLTKHSIPHVP